jgi:hypothetical protein
MLSKRDRLPHRFPLLRRHQRLFFGLAASLHPAIHSANHQTARQSQRLPPNFALPLILFPYP